MSDLATLPAEKPAPLRTLSAQLNFTPEDVEAVRNIIAPGAPEHIIRLVMYRCQQLGADPLGKNIYAINRPRKTGKSGIACPACGKYLRKSRNEGEGWYCWRAKDGCGKNYPEDAFGDVEPETEDNWVLQSSIDFFRSIAESSDGYRGQVGPFWCGPNREWQDVWLDGTPAAAKVGVRRASFDEPLYAVARFKSYSAGGPMWEKMPEVMIAKCAEALAIRRAFPSKLTGIYIAEEMEQAANDAPHELEKAPQDTPALVAGQQVGTALETPANVNPDRKADALADAAATDPAEESRRALIAWIETNLAKVSIPDDDLQSYASTIRERTLATSPDADLSITYDWRELDERELRDFYSLVPKKARQKAAVPA